MVSRSPREMTSAGGERSGLLCSVMRVSDVSEPRSMGSTERLLSLSSRSVRAVRSPIDSGIESSWLFDTYMTCSSSKSPIETGSVCKWLSLSFSERSDERLPITAGTTSRWFLSIHNSVSDVMSVTSHGTFLSRLLDNASRVRFVVSIPSSGIDWMPMPLRSRVSEPSESYMRARYSSTAAVPLAVTSVGGVRRLDFPISNSTRLVRVPRRGGSMWNLLPPQCNSTIEESMQTTGGSCARPLLSIERELRLVKCTSASGSECSWFSFKFNSTSLESFANSGGSSTMRLPDRLSSERSVRTKVSIGTADKPMSTRSKMPLSSASSKRRR
mmetsp:Transcript_41849/g.98223  ORF Transcript_41849/g.98223 Transcript_41849/m.98223 type:complete len:328 (+) Transcript_41849:1423-2406(+)